MSKAEYWQRGEALDYTNSTSSPIEANTIVAFGGRVGVTGAPILPGETGTLLVTGVYEMSKTATEAIEMGATVYFDGTGITNAADDGSQSNPASYTMAGYAAAAAAADDKMIKVKLLS